MSLLKEIIAEAIAKTADVPRMLRLCLVLASKLKHEPLRDWVQHELEGYPPNVHLPCYRVLRGRNYGEFMGGGLQGVLDLPTSLLPEKLQPFYEKAELRDGISEYAHLLAKTTDGVGGLQMPWPMGLAIEYASKLVTHGQCIRAWIELSPAELAGMIDKVKTKVLAFALEIEAEAPDAGEIESPTSQPMKDERVSQIFSTTIQGGVQNYSAGGSNINQVAIGSIQAGNIESLISALQAVGLTDDDLEKLKSSLNQDAAKGATGIGEGVKAWLGDLAIRAGQGIAGVGVDVATGVVVQAIFTFLGISA